jgi:hypothetical protein
MNGKRLWWKAEFVLTRWWRPSEVRWRRRKRRSGLGERGAWYALYGCGRTGNVTTDLMDAGLQKVAWSRALGKLADAHAAEVAEANARWTIPA